MAYFDKREHQEAALEYIRKYATEEGVCESNPLIALKRDTQYWEYKNALTDDGHYVHPEFRQQVEEALTFSRRRLALLEEGGGEDFIEHDDALAAIKDEIQRGEYNSKVTKKWQEVQKINGEKRDVTITKEERRRSPRLPLLMKVLDQALPTERQFTMFIADITQVMMTCGMFREDEIEKLTEFIDKYHKNRLRTIRLSRMN